LFPPVHHRITRVRVGEGGLPVTGTVLRESGRHRKEGLMPVLTPRRAAVARLIVVAGCLPVSLVVAGDDPFADVVVSYIPGSNPAPASGFTNPAVTLGQPERISGEPLFPGPVTPFQSAYLAGELVSIGGGGSLVLHFNTPVTNDPANPFGIDLLVFGNAFFLDSNYPAAIVGGIAAEGGTIAVSADGVVWHTIPGVQADGLFPTQGYTDIAAYATAPGSAPSDFTRPVDPGVTIDDCIGLGHEQVVALYDGSGGGAGVDLAAVGLESINFVRIANAAGAAFTVEIDAVSDVAPASPPQDLNGDGHVNGFDLALLLGAWGPGRGAADLNGDGQVNGLDLALLLGGWTG
jgi:Dockerin type I domain